MANDTLGGNYVSHPPNPAFCKFKDLFPKSGTLCQGTYETLTRQNLQPWSGNFRSLMPRDQQKEQTSLSWQGHHCYQDEIGLGHSEVEEGCACVQEVPLRTSWHSFRQSGAQSEAQPQQPAQPRRAWLPRVQIFGTAVWVMSPYPPSLLNFFKAIHCLGNKAQMPQHSCQGHHVLCQSALDCVLWPHRTPPSFLNFLRNFMPPF